MGLKLLILDTRRRCSSLRRARSSASACAICSRSMCGDQRALVARATKSSKLAGSARRPICCSWWARLFIGVVGAMVVVGEFIVSLQVVRLHIDGLHLGMTAKIDGHGCRRGCGLLPLA